MPNRIIKETIISSKSVNALNDFQFRVWLYLITYADDYGRGSADPELLKGFVFPRRKSVTEAQIAKALSDLANTGMIVLYNVGGEPFFYFPNWSDHQRIQTKKSKFPEPEETTLSHGNSPSSTVSHGEPPPESESNTNTNPNTNPNPNTKNICTEQDSAPVAAWLPLNDGTVFAITEDKVAAWEGLYPAVDVRQEINKMIGWLDANPKNRKTRSGIMKFCNSWLSRTQDQGGRRTRPSGGGNVFYEIATEGQT